MASREELIDHIRKWIQLEKEIKEYRALVKQMNQEKKNISNMLIDVMKSNEIDTIDINNGKLMYKKTTIKAPLSKKHLIKCLSEFYKNDAEMVEELSTHILDTRETKISESIKHKN